MVFKFDYGEQFDEGKLKNMIQYMWPGQETNHTIIFDFQGLSVQVILDRLPGAEIIDQKEQKYTIRANLYGDGGENLKLGKLILIFK